MRASVQKWGNSLGIRIPKVFADDTALRSGSIVELVLVKGAIVVRPIRGKRARYRLEDLVNGITSSNRHAEVSTGVRRGREAW